MKKIILLATLVFGAFTATAQDIAVTMQGGLVIEDGYTFTTNSIASPNQLSTPNKFRFHVTNLTQEEMKVGVKVLGISGNTNGGDVQLCFGVCLYSIQEGYIVSSGEAIPAGETTTSDEDHFISFTAGTDGQPVQYQFAFVKLETNEDNELIQVGEPLLHFNYTYQPTASVDGVNGLHQMGITVNNTVVNSNLGVNATEAAKLQIYSITGALVKSAVINSGSNNVDLSAFANGMYIAKFATAEKSGVVRIIKN